MPERKCKGVGNFATKSVATATSLEILEKNFRSIIYTQNAFIWCKNAKIARGLCFAYDTILVAAATSLEESEKLDRIKKIHANTFHLVIWRKIVKIGPVDTEIALLIVKK